MFSLRCRVFFLLFPLVLLAAFPLPARAAGGAPHLSVFVSILPEVFFVHRIGGERVRVEPLVLPGRSPATYAPTPRQLASLSRADLYFRIGVPFEEALLPRLQHSMPDLPVIDLRNGISLLTLPDGQAGSMDPHIWLDPVLVSRLSVTIRNELTRLDPAGATVYAANCERFQQELDELDRRLHRLLDPHAEQTLYVFHPAYAYFCRAYNLVQKPVAPEGKMPGTRYLATLLEQAGREKIRAIFIQPQFSSKTARALAERIGAELVPLDPLAEDYMANLLEMGRKIAAALAPGGVAGTEGMKP